MTRALMLLLLTGCAAPRCELVRAVEEAYVMVNCHDGRGMILIPWADIAGPHPVAK